VGRRLRCLEFALLVIVGCAAPQAFPNR